PTEPWMASRKIPRPHQTRACAVAGKAFFFGSFLLTLIKRNELARRRRAKAVASHENETAAKTGKHPLRRAQVRSGQVRSGQVRSGQVNGCNESSSTPP